MMTVFQNQNIIKVLKSTQQQSFSEAEKQIHSVDK